MCSNRWEWNRWLFLSLRLLDRKYRAQWGQLILQKAQCPWRWISYCNKFMALEYIYTPICIHMDIVWPTMATLQTSSEGFWSCETLSPLQTHVHLSNKALTLAITIMQVRYNKNLKLHWFRGDYLKLQHTWCLRPSEQGTPHRPLHYKTINSLHSSTPHGKHKEENTAPTNSEACCGPHVVSGSWGCKGYSVMCLKTPTLWEVEGCQRT